MDPGFLPAFIGYVVSESIKNVIRCVRQAVKSKERCRKLGEKLEKLLPRVHKIEEQVNNGQMRYEGAVRDWLDNLKATADQARVAVHKCSTKSIVPWQLSKVSEELEELHARIERLEERDFDFSLHLETQQTLSFVVSEISHIRRQSLPCHLSVSASSDDYYNMQAAPSVGPNHIATLAHYNSAGPHSSHLFAEGRHHPVDHRMDPWRNDPKLTRAVAMQREEVTRRQENQWYWRADQ